MTRHAIATGDSVAECVRYCKDVLQHQHRLTECTRNNGNELEPVQIATVLFLFGFILFSHFHRFLLSIAVLSLALVQMRQWLYTTNQFYRPHSHQSTRTNTFTFTVKIIKHYTHTLYNKKGFSEDIAILYSCTRVRTHAHSSYIHGVCVRE